MPWIAERALALSLLIVSGPVPAGETPPLASPSLQTDSVTATAGFYRLSWEHPATTAPLDFELQESLSADFAGAKPVYTGPDRATSHSGRADGDYHFRVRALDGERSSAWSPAVTVQVRHHSFLRAGLFFALGALVFVATLIVILRGNAPEERA